MGTIHANSARDAIMKLMTLPLLAGANISHAFIVPTVASAIDLVIHVEMSHDGTRRVLEIVSLNGRVENMNIEIESVFRWDGASYIRGVGFTTLNSRIQNA
jgi:pilus assembly protein CpaF